MECIKNPEICIIVALAEKNRVIGKDNQMPWHIPADLQRFKQITLGSPVIMGRKTFESIGRPLPGRLNVVISGQKFEGCLQANSVFDALYTARRTDLQAEKFFIIGGGRVYEQAMMTGMANRLYLTLVDGDFTGDTYFPDYSNFTKVVSQEAGESNGYKFRWLELERED